MAYNSPLWHLLNNLNGAAQQPPHPPPNSHGPPPPFPFPPTAFGPAFEAFAPFFHPPPPPPPPHSRPCPCPQTAAATEDAPPQEEQQHQQQQPHPPFNHGHPHPHPRGHRGHHGRGRRGAPQWPLGNNGAPFDIAALIDAFASHPLAAALRTYVEEARGGAEGGEAATDPNVAGAAADSKETTSEKEKEDASEEAGFEEAFSPALDIFSTPTSYVLHVALPGAKKEDVGVNWDAESGEVSVAGVVYRGGDEEFLAGLRSAERRVGAFKRTVKLPLKGEEERGVEVDGEEIAARLEDGVLVVTVGKRERTEREVRRVNIE